MLSIAMPLHQIAAHQSRQYYAADATSQFKQYCLNEGEIITGINDTRNVLFYVSEGGFRVTLGHYSPRKTDRGYLFFPCKIPASAGKIPPPRKFPELAVSERPVSFYSTLFHHLEVGLNRHHFNGSNARSCIFLLRGYHGSEDVYSLLHSVIGHNDDFKDFVFRSYKEVDVVSRFAALVRMSVRNFQRKFKSEFGCSVREWLIERRVESILWDIRGTDKRISDLASDYGFSTPSSFTSFCKRHFGHTPSELRRQPRSMSFHNMQAPFPDFPEGGEIPRVFSAEKIRSVKNDR